MDLIDHLIDSLSPSALDALDEMDGGTNNPVSRLHSSELQITLDGAEAAHLRRSTREVNEMTETLSWKTRDATALLEKFKKQYEMLQSGGDAPKDQKKKLKVYREKVQASERKLQHLTRKSSDLKAEEVFTQIEDANKLVEKFETMIGELGRKLKSYKDFPASVKEGEYCIAALKERIQKKESCQYNFHKAWNL